MKGLNCNISTHLLHEEKHFKFHSTFSYTAWILHNKERFLKRALVQIANYKLEKDHFESNLEWKSMLFEEFLEKVKPLNT